jgi:UDP-galactopyranose mutase
VTAGADRDDVTRDDFDVVCFSHLRWNFVWQRPQHLLERWARERRAFFVEEPVLGTGPRLDVRIDSGVHVVVPHLPEGLDAEEVAAAQRELLEALLRDNDVSQYVLWLYTPMALELVDGLEPLATVYDCMDELSAFAGAPAELKTREASLLARTDIVFTGGQSLYEAKRQLHKKVYCFPSSLDVEHYLRAREPLSEPSDQRAIPQPRAGFFGVIDERIDLDLLEATAARQPDWHFVLIGPMAKIEPASLPQRPNLHYLGLKRYEELPSYLAGWDVAIMPFALNDATRFISPTKTLRPARRRRSLRREPPPRSRGSSRRSGRGVPV